MNGQRSLQLCLLQALLVSWLGTVLGGTGRGLRQSTPSVSATSSSPIAYGAQTGGAGPAIDVTSAPYGADPSGAVGSSNAFNAAILAAESSGKTVYVPPGTYQLNKDIIMDVDGVTVTAPVGASFTYTNPAPGGIQWFLNGNSNTVQNLNVDCDGTAWSGFVVLGSNNNIIGCSAMNCGAHGFDFDGQQSSCSGNTISGSTASNNMMIGIAQNHCSQNVITGNTLMGNMFEGITADNQADGAQITGNTLTGNAISGGVGGIGVDFSNDVVVSNNIITGSGNYQPGLKTQNNLGPTTGLSVTGNTITNNAGVAVWLFCNGANCASGSTVSGNTVSGNLDIGNFCDQQILEDNLGSNSITC